MSRATRVAFLRGVNVGGHGQVPMAALRAELGELGFGDVRTYIQSGNVVYEPPAGTRSNAAALRRDATAIAEAVERHHGLRPGVVVLSAAQLAGHLAASPYRDADPAQAFVVFVDGVPSDIGDLARYATSGERWTVRGDIVHLHCPNGLGRSKLAARLAASRRPTTTARNLRTIEAVLALADAG